MTTVTRGQLVDVWDAFNGDAWLRSNNGNCYCIARDTFPELHEAAGQYNIIFTIEHVRLANERWAYVSCLGHVIVPPFRITSPWDDPVDPWEKKR